MRERELESDQHVPPVPMAPRPLFLAKVLPFPPLRGACGVRLELQEVETTMEKAAHEYPLPGRATRPPAGLDRDTRVQQVELVLG